MKPHGPGRDATRILDKLIEQDATNPDKRPQMLVLTGDQIYADDVADALLHMIMDASSTLINIGWDENIPEIGFISQLKPGRRSKAARQIGFTSEVIKKPQYSKSHLLGLDEYILMYVFAWSDVLWCDALPDFQTVYEEPKEDQDWSSRFETECENLMLFMEDRWRVRRALANIPTYMIFDDHEVSDDWYINSDWTIDNLFLRPSFRHVIANALTAYAVCQAWGNTPDLFKDGQPGGRLLAKLSSQVYRTNHLELEKQLLPPRDAIMGKDYQLNQPVDPIPWHYSLTFDAFELVVLDTRTRRQFPDLATGFPYVIGEESLLQQLPNPAKKTTFSRDLVVLVMAAPLVGNPGIEAMQSTRQPGWERLDHDCEAPGLQPLFFERFLSRLAQAAPRVGNIRRANIVIFSGDVHYSFSARLRYSATRPFEGDGAAELVITQLTASAQKNRPAEWYLKYGCHIGGLTETYVDIFGGLPLPNTQFFPPIPCSVLGFNDFKGLSSEDAEKLNQACEEQHEFLKRWPEIRLLFRPPKCKVPLKRRTSGVYPVRFELLGKPTGILSITSDWRYYVEYLTDTRGKDERRHSWGRESVGLNNIGDVRFDIGCVVFDLWYYIDGDDQPESALPGTQTVSSFDFDEM